MSSKRVLPLTLGLCLLALGVAWFLAESRGRDEPVQGPLELSEGSSVLGGVREREAVEHGALEAPESEREGEPPARKLRGPRAEPEPRTPVDARTPTTNPPLAPPVALLGRVVSPGGTPLGGATVLAAARTQAGPWALDGEAASTRSAVTDAFGRFVLAPLEPGHQRLSVRAAGCAHLDLDDVWLPRAQVDLGDLVLEEGAKVDGKVLGRQGRPLAGARLTLLHPFLPWPASELNPRAGAPVALTNANGRFETEQLPEGPWTLIVSHPLHTDLLVQGTGALANARFELERGESTTVDLAERTALPTMVHAVPVHVAFDPRWKPPGSYAAGYRAVGAALGSNVLRGLPEDSRSVVHLRPVGLAADEPYRPPFRALVPAGDQIELAPGQGTILEGEVKDLETGAALVKLTLRLEGAWPEAPSLEIESTGRFRSELVFPLGDDHGETPTLHVRALGYEPLEVRDLDLKHGQVLDLDGLELRRLPSMQVLVHGPDGTPLRDAEVRVGMFVPGALAAEEGDGWTDPVVDLALTDRAGLAWVQAPPKGGFVRVQAPWYGPVELPISTSADGVMTVKLDRPGVVEVQVVGLPGARPCTQVLRAVHGPTPWGQEQGGAWVVERKFPDADGRAVFTGLGTGRALFAALPLPVVGPEDPGHLKWTDVEIAPGPPVVATVSAARFEDFAGVLRFGGAPLVGADLVLEWGPGRFTWSDGGESPVPPARGRTDRRGRFLIPNLLRGDHSLTIRMPGGQLTRRDVYVGGGKHRIDLRDTRVLGSLVDEVGQPLPDVQVVVRPHVERAALRSGMLVSELLPPAPICASTWGSGSGGFELAAFPSGVPCELSFRGPSGLEAQYLILPQGEVHTLHTELGPDAEVQVRMRIRSRTTRDDRMALIGISASDETQLRPLVQKLAGWGASEVQLALRAGTWNLHLASLADGVWIRQLGPAHEIEVDPGQRAEVSIDWPPRQSR